MGNSVACDIGVAFIEITIKLDGPEKPFENAKSFHYPPQNCTFYFIRYLKSEIHHFKTSEIYSQIPSSITPIIVCGINYDSFYDTLPQIFNCDFARSSKSNYTALALNFLWQSSPMSFYEYDMINPPLPDGSVTVRQEDYARKIASFEEFYPYLLVNVKSGVSMYLVTSPVNFEKIGGSCLGLNSIWALLKSDENASFDATFDHVLDGNSTNVDMTVGDIYGCRYSFLPEKLTASTCGKLKDDPSYSSKDLTKSLLFMLLFNLGQIAGMHCFDLKVNKMIVIGSVFLNEGIEKLMRFTFNYYSKNILKLYFCDYSQYLRAFGVILQKNLLI
ncbi:hypothetical protein SteCoe_26150 [Stentor coeruleus]|uniref:Pantothenate kinase n=1 Tax=Stentor coeruleus TaxID=5963 RepID=A0A1R2BDM8_9CILI|nr:hypothetical protein SteCoe_26150 [Stentor coeruleus]